MTGIVSITIDGMEAPHSGIEIDLGEDERLRAAAISKSSALDFPLKKSVVLHMVGFGPLANGNHEIVVQFEATPFGALDLKVTDAIAEATPKRVQIPYDKEDDHNQRMAETRQGFVFDYSGKKLEHVNRYSFDPAVTRGNIENFVGVAQIPICLPGPLRGNGEHAQRQFLSPPATT